MPSQTDRYPTLLVSGVDRARSADEREAALTARLTQSVVTRATEAGWKVQLSWGEVDGEAGTLARLAAADAVVIMGGPDISPDLYGASPDYQQRQTHFPRSDRAQIALARQAVAARLPLVGICRGMQVLNVALGGTLIQHLDLDGHVSPTLLDDFIFPLHRVVPDQATAFGQVLARAAGQDEVTVHSAHHQAVDQLAADLIPAAWSPDGVLEAVEHRSAPAWGVQWHPEDPDADPALMVALLGELRRHCCMSAAPSSELAIA